MGDPLEKLPNYEALKKAAIAKATRNHGTRRYLQEELTHLVDTHKAQFHFWKRRLLRARQTRDQVAKDHAYRMVCHHRRKLCDWKMEKEHFSTIGACCGGQCDHCDGKRRRLEAMLSESEYNRDYPAGLHRDVCGYRI